MAENGRIFLIHDGYKFIKYGCGQKTRYWKCRQSFKYECKAKIATEIVKGREMLHIQCGSHDHIQLRSYKTNSK